MTTTDDQKKSILAGKMGNLAVLVSGGTMATFAVSGKALADIAAEAGILVFLLIVAVLFARWFLNQWEQRERNFYSELAAQRDQHNREIERRDIVLDKLADGVSQTASSLTKLSQSVDRLHSDLESLRAEVRSHTPNHHYPL